MKRCVSWLSVLAMITLLTSCAAGNGAFHADKDITVLSREEGSGTRGAFVSLFGVTDSGGLDNIVNTAEITDNTAVMMASVAQNLYAMGYLSLGSLNGSVKALSVDGITPTVDNIKNGSYPVVRSFLLVTKGTLSGVAADFFAFILSAEGQQVVEKNRYVAVGGVSPFAGTQPAGRCVVGGSSSVAPLMEKLKEAYQTVNPEAAIEIQQSDSTTGIQGTAEGTFEIGMSSRNLKESESAKGLSATPLGKDGIVLIVHLQNPLQNLSGAQVRGIYQGTIKRWEEVLQ